MFYYNARYHFKLPDLSTETIPGGIIAASAVMSHALLRRRFQQFGYLQHRLLDPQLYLAELAAERASEVVTKLASYPWFSIKGIPEYDTSVHGKQAEWTAQYRDQILQAWPGRAVSDPTAVRRACFGAIRFQQQLGTDGIILPSVLTRAANTGYETELLWLDTAVEVSEELGVRAPLYATVAIADTVFRGVAPDENSVINIITDQVTARPISGLYLIVEQGNEAGYCCEDRSTIGSILRIVDDCVRGASMRVILNYASAFGAVATAAGADIWSVVII